MFDIPIRVHWSWALGFIFITWSLASISFPMPAGITESQRWLIAGFITMSLFGSVLLHELAHSITAKRLGHRVMGITLLIFGGVSLIDEDRQTPAHDFMIALAGPLMSFAIGVLSLLLLSVLSSPGATGPAAMFEGWLRYMGWMNLILAAFNMLPGIPLDGGRVLEAVVWGVSGSRDIAMRVSTLAGKAVSILIIFYGVYLIFVAGNVMGGIWLIFIGMFIGSAASGASRSASRIRAARNAVGIQVRQAMIPTPTGLDARMPLHQAVSNVLSRYPDAVVPVITNGKVSSFVTLRDATSLGINTGVDINLTVADVAQPGSTFPISWDEDISIAVQTIERRKVDRLLVFEGSQMIGTLGRQEISEHMSRETSNSGRETAEETE